ncbi:MAG: YkuS family protein [Clostridiaceae bacterium]|nr:YkuS family protein [Clostridiaceae bacterium]
MTVCVANELNYVKIELEKRGYIVISKLSEAPCKAIICNLKNGGLINYNLQNSIKAEGTIIIDSGCKTIDEIEYILNNRVYSSLL